MQHPFDGVIEQPDHFESDVTADSMASTPTRYNRRGLLGYTVAAVGALGALTTRSAIAQDDNGETANLQRDADGRSRDRRDGGDDGDAQAQHRRGRGGRWDYRDDDRDRDRRRRRRRREDEEWYDRLDSYYFGRNWWGPEYDRRRRRGRYTTQALGEEGGRGRRGGRNRYTTQALGEEGGRSGRRRDYYDYWDRWGRDRRGRRDRNQRRRYTTYALGEEG